MIITNYAEISDKKNLMVAAVKIIIISISEAHLMRALAAFFVTAKS